MTWLSGEKTQIVLRKDLDEKPRIFIYRCTIINVFITIVQSYSAQKKTNGDAKDYSYYSPRII
jgi:hypothetical protein